MSRMTMHWIGSEWRPTGENDTEYRNAWLGHIMVWQSLGDRYGVPFSFANPNDIWGLARHPDDPQAVATNRPVAFCDRVVMAATFDRVWLRRENFQRFASHVAGAKLPENCHWNAVAKDLILALGDPAVRGVCWQGTSVSSDVWHDGQRYLSVEELGATEVFDLVTAHYRPPAAGGETAAPAAPKGEAGSVPHDLGDGRVNDPAHYRRMCEPFDSPAEAQDAITKFFQGVRELRDELGIPDVVSVVEVAVKVPAGDDGRPDTSPQALAEAKGGPPARWAEVRLSVHAINGNPLLAPVLLARTLAREQDAQHAAVLEALDGQTRERAVDAPLDPEAKATLAVAEAHRATEVAVSANKWAKAAVAKAEAALVRAGKGPLKDRPQEKIADPGANPPPPAAV